MVNKLAAVDRRCRSCAEQINGGGFDVFLAHPCKFFAATSIGRHVDVPKHLYLQEPYRSVYQACPRLPGVGPPPPDVWPSISYLKGFLRDLVEAQAKRVQVREELANVCGFDRILVNSYFSREGVLRAFGIDSTVCYMGVDTESFRPTGCGQGGIRRRTGQHPGAQGPGYRGGRAGHDRGGMEAGLRLDRQRR